MLVILTDLLLWWFAASNGDKKCVEVLIKAGADVNATHSGFTTLMFAAMEGNGKLCGGSSHCRS